MAQVDKDSKSINNRLKTILGQDSQEDSQDSIDNERFGKDDFQPLEGEEMKDNEDDKW